MFNLLAYLQIHATYPFQKLENNVGLVVGELFHLVIQSFSLGFSELLLGSDGFL